MTKPEALRMVASYMAGMMLAGGLEEVTGLRPTVLAAMPGADIDRLEWASSEVIRRLYMMGNQKDA